MAKSTTKNAPARKASPPVVKNTGSRAVAPSNDLDALMEQDAGHGVSTAQEDNIVPLVYVLQAQSPQAMKGNKEAFVKGAEAGSIWLRGTTTVFSGEEGILVQPCHFDKVWIEWRPNRGGFVARHKERPAVAEQQATDPKKPDRLSWVMPSGNIVSETREHVVLLHGDDGSTQGFVIPFSGSNNGASRAWMGLLKSKRTKNGNIAPDFAYLYRLTTKFRSNDDGDWYMWQAQDGGDNGEPLQATVEQYLQGRQLASDFSSGALRADNPDAVDSDETILDDHGM